MSVPPQMIAQLLQGQGGSQGQQGIQGPTNASSAAALMQKIMMIKALQGQQQPGQPPNNVQGGLNAAPQIPGQMVPQQMMQLQNPQGPGAQNG